MSGRGFFSERLVQSMDIPRLAMKGCPHIEMEGNREAIIDGCIGILEYDEDRIALNLGSIGIRFCGTDMRIVSFETQRTVICGCFATVEFC